MDKKNYFSATDNGEQSKTTTYYVKGNQALIKLGDFTAGKKRDDYSVDVQVVCKVTDPDVLLGTKKKIDLQIRLHSDRRWTGYQYSNQSGNYNTEKA